MALKEIQKEVHTWVKGLKIGYFKPLEILARLTEKVGELARELNHRYGPKKKKPTEETKEIFSEHDVIFSHDECVVLTDEKIITCQGPKFAETFGQAILNLLN